ncbi:hypothetical protein HPB47_021798, partial [Ixodes persulcatus]
VTRRTKTQSRNASLDPDLTDKKQMTFHTSFVVHCAMLAYPCTRLTDPLAAFFEASVRRRAQCRVVINSTGNTCTRLTKKTSEP